MQREEKLVNEMGIQSYLLRGCTVMIDKDLAKLYEVETNELKRAVRRNMKRFPPDFMFELANEEKEKLKLQMVALNSQAIRDDSIEPNSAPDVTFVFTEVGVAMLSGVLKSKKAAEVGVAIMTQLFSRM